MKRARTEKAKDDRREALASAALDVFYENGFAAARMEDIACRAGLSKGAIYLYFESKEALFEAVVDSFARPNVERLEAAAATTGGIGAIIDAIAALAPAIIREGRLPKIVKILTGDAPAFPAVTSAYRKTVIERGLAALSGVLAKAKERGEITIGDPALTARLIAAPIIFSAIWRVVFEHDDDAQVNLDALFSEHGALLKRALNISEAAP